MNIQCDNNSKMFFISHVNEVLQEIFNLTHCVSRHCYSHTGFTSHCFKKNNYIYIKAYNQNIVGNIAYFKIINIDFSLLENLNTLFKLTGNGLNIINEYCNFEITPKLSLKIEYEKILNSGY